MKKLLFLAGVLLAGCRSEQVAFHFQPVASTAVATKPRAVAPAEAPEAPAPVSSSAALPPPTEPSHPATAPTQPLRQRSVAKLTQALPPLATATVPMRAARRLAQHLHRQQARGGAAESGLGNIGLFFIGVVLAVLAGLAALVNVIFGVGFFTALGYTAAGLVVLGVLYLLLSGKK
ncbi:hypothetical protein GO988_06850 [Hymenobacter sp. HMF4947]|uniref:Uncharacterized protein n=1 Tax=Hymenobacter ginkgonis TaxID=2682976 RepID=A0A7K1TCA3_9BACT|nr:hypothetical protein [Hymenobacter ginkgonis]MVN76038.1 hypothetical protein [Hymenobacter ginkgonis]